MNRASALAAIGLCAAVAAVQAIGFVGKDEAVAMVKKGVAFIRANGPERGYAEISNKRGRLHDRDLYLVVYGMDGVVRADGANERMVGRNASDLRDIDGKPFVQECIELAQTRGAFWHEYKFTNPITRMVEPKQSYCERLGDTVVCGGTYKR